MIFQAELTFVSESDELISIPMLEKMGLNFLLKPEFKEKAINIELSRESVNVKKFFEYLPGNIPMITQINEYGIVLYGVFSRNRRIEGDCTIFIPFGNILSISSREF